MKMPKSILSHELDQLVELISSHHEGVGIDALLQAIGDTMPRRTLQRRLALLVEQGRIQTSGESRALRYILAPKIIKVSFQEHVDAKNQASSEAYIPTSPEGEEIKAYVRRPRQLRSPVGYKLAFLEQYHPNQTSYLPLNLRDQLHLLGRSPAPDTCWHLRSRHSESLVDRPILGIFAT